MSDIFAEIAQVFRTMPRMAPPVTFHGSDLMTVTEEDWSNVRSPGRAARRRKQGHRQRIVYRQVPDPRLIHDAATGRIVGHPVTIERAMQAVAEKSASSLREQQETAYLNAIFGRI